MQVDITEYVKGCADCQRHKVNTRPTKAPLQPIYPKAETTPFETVALDFIVKLPISQGFNSILTITDQGCTKAAIFIPCNEDITAEETAALYIKHIFAHFGLPTKVISDRDPLLRFAKRCPTWTMIMWMQPLMTQLWSSDTRYSNTRSLLYVRRRSSTSTNIDK
jgi:hypothetical protein